MKKSVLWIVAVALTALSSPVGAATPAVPTACKDARNLRTFNSGHLLGVQMVQRAWGVVDDCTRIADFQEIINTNVANYVLGKNPSTNTACRYSGVVAGVLDELNNVLAECSECYAEGEMVGDVSAIAYCELSFAFGGLGTADAFLRGPVDVCGAGFQTGCDKKFVDSSKAYQTADGVCVQYTVNPFYEVWDQVRNNQCAYDPIVPDPGQQP